MRVVIYIILACLLLVTLYGIWCGNHIEPFISNEWKTNARNIYYDDHYLEAELKDDNGEWNYNRIELHPLLKNQPLINNNGSFKYNVSEEDAQYILPQIFPLYTGKTIPVTKIDNCVILSIRSPKYNKIRDETLDILSEYRLPPIEIYFGYTEDTIKKAPFYDYMMHYDSMRYELVLGMLDVFDNFINKYNNRNAWLLFFEDDVRPVNIDTDEDLTVLYNIPEDAELIRPYLGSNESADMKNMTYYKSFGGGMNHAFYISVSGCKKVMHYLKKHKWRYQSDMDLYRLSTGCGGFPTNIDHGWSLVGIKNNNNISPLLTEDEKIHTYYMKNLIFNQTSNPCL